MKICFVPSNLDASGQYRCFLPARELTALGHKAGICPHRVLHHKDNPRFKIIQFAGQIEGEDAGIQKLLPALDADLYVFQQMQEPIGLLTADILRANGKVVVSETDDDWFNIPTYNPMHKQADPIENSDRNTYWLHKIFNVSDAMTVSTPALQELYGKINPSVHLVRNYLDWRMWADAPQQSEVERKRVRVGWMGDTKWRAGDLHVLRGVLAPWLEKHPNVDFVAAGDPRTHDLLNIPKAQRITTGVIDFRNGDLADITATMDIGLVPQDRHPFSEAKSHLKGMEYAACGIPCIATPTESYADYWLKDAEIGLLARKPKDWLAALNELVGDDELRRTMGRAARAKAAEHTIQQNAYRWENTYRVILGKEPNASEAPSIDHLAA